VCAYTQAHEMGEWDIKSFSDLILLYYCKRHRSYTATQYRTWAQLYELVLAHNTHTHVYTLYVLTHTQK